MRRLVHFACRYHGRAKKTHVLNFKTDLLEINAELAPCTYLMSATRACNIINADPRFHVLNLHKTMRARFRHVRIYRHVLYNRDANPNKLRQISQQVVDWLKESSDLETFHMVVEVLKAHRRRRENWRRAREDFCLSLASKLRELFEEEQLPLNNNPQGPKVPYIDFVPRQLVESGQVI